MFNMKSIYKSFWFFFLQFLATAHAKAPEPTPEELFRLAVHQWQSSGTRNYQSFNTLADKLQDIYESTNPKPNKLEVVGAMEESILVLERFIFEEQQGRQDSERDKILSKLYTVYAFALSHLTPDECLDLAMDPHTLLIGAEETIQQWKKTKLQDPPSNKLCLENADNSARNAATLDATNNVAEELLKTLNAGNIHERKPMEFVAELFDAFAENFDEKLLDNLQYRVPQLIGTLTRDLLSKDLSKSKFQNALDAGCGTGLAGRHIRNLVENAMIGVDASQKMLDKAKNCTRSVGCGILEEKGEEGDHRPLYDNLLLMDLEEMTVDNTLYHDSRSSPNGFDLIVAADVLVYFGSLDKLFETFSNISTQGSLLIFTCEKATEEEAPLGWRLTTSGRFAHTKEHAIHMAEKVGYTLEYHQDIVPRMEKGEPVKGHLFGFLLTSKRETPLVGDL